MSHSVTIQTRTVTTGSPSAINLGFCRTWTGILKLAQVILGAVCVGLAGYVINHYYRGFTSTENLFFLLVTTSFMIASCILVLSCLCSYTTESIISKTIFELLYHAIAFGLVLAASITLLTKVTQTSTRNDHEKMELAAAIIGLINAALYLVSTIFALRSSRGL